MDVNTFTRQFEDSIDGAEPNSLKPETEFRTIENWDSLAVLTILAMIDAEYNVNLTAEEFTACTTIQSVYSLIEKKLQEAGS